MDTRQFHKRCFALLLVCALALGCLPRAQAASRSAIESLQSQQASLTVQKAELQKKLDRQIRCRQDLLKNLEMSRKLDRFMNAAMLAEEIE